ncbi:site-specific tyrosine recombinase XerD [Nocardia callitridis]|uniref:Tyrosine recombinase XerD n=1 Tax=Nocardia callitridis TaxID=648753 RepID=A0ABP9KJ76_9NOCA
MLARTTDAYLDHLAVERGATANTLGAYRRDLSRYLEFLSGRAITSLDRVTEHDVAEFTVALRAGGALCADGVAHPPLAASSVARALIAVRGLHRFAAAEGMTTEDVAHAVKPPTAGRRLPKALPYDQVLLLLDAAGGAPVGEGAAAAGTLGEGAAASGSLGGGAAAAGSDGGPRGLRDRALLELLYSTGARISEVIALDLDDLSAASEERAVVLHGKGGKQRMVPIGRPALAAVDAYLVRGRPVLTARGKGDAAALFVNVRGGRLSRQSAWQVLRTAAERAGIRATVSPHTLRHSFATHLLDGGADVRVVQELLGHASVTTTQIYTLVTVNTLREVWATAHPRAR